MPRVWWRAGHLAVVAAMLLLASVPAAAVAQGASVIRGHVVVSRAGGPVPAAGAWVVLHRVAPGSAGPVDSVQAGADGGFAFRSAFSPNDSAFVFVSSSHHGIAYFSTPTRGARAGAREAEIVAFDTSSTGPPMVTRGRHVVIQRAGSDRRTVLEVFDLENTGPTTRVASGDGASVTLPVPRVADAPRADQGDIAAEAMRFADDHVDVLAPLAPGLRQASVRYGLPVTRFPLALAVRERSAVVEVVLEDSTATVSGAAFGAPEMVTIEGRRFRRVTAQDVPAGATITIGNMPGSGVATWQVALLVVMTAALIGVGIAAQRRREATVTEPVMARVGLAGLSAARSTEAEQLARKIAALDAAFRARESPDAETRAVYEAERATLKAALAQRLAGNDSGA
jgi:hypothetical protein